MAENVLERVRDDDLAVHVVWLPVLPPDDLAAAREAAALIPDARAKHYWDGDQALGKVYGKTMALPSGRELAWDIYFVFDAGIVWGDEVPAATDWVHQLGTDERHLGDGASLRESVRRLLKGR